MRSVLSVDDFRRRDVLLRKRGGESGNPTILDSYIANATEEKELAGRRSDDYAPTQT